MSSGVTRHNDSSPNPVQRFTTVPSGKRTVSPRWKGWSWRLLAGFVLGLIVIGLPRGSAGNTRIESPVYRAPNAAPVITQTGLTIMAGKTATGNIAGASDDCGISEFGFNPDPAAGISIISVNSFISGNTGTVTATVGAACGLAPGVYQVGTASAIDDAKSPPMCLSPGGPQLMANGVITVRVIANPVPTLGTYTDMTTGASSTVTVTPTAPPADASNDIREVTVSPQDLPGGGTVVVNPATGVVTITTDTGTTAGEYPIAVTVTDACNSKTTQSFKLTVTQTLVNTAPLLTTIGGVTVSQGGAENEADVATTTDEQEDATALQVSLSDIPAGISVRVVNTAGTVRAFAQAACSVAPNIYPVSLTVSDTGVPVAPPLTTSTTFNVTVTGNAAPTLGSYSNLTLVQGGSATQSPAAPPSDRNNNISRVTVTPTSLPGGGSLTVDAVSGAVRVTTVSATQPGTYPIRVVVADPCVEASAGFQLVVNKPQTRPAAPTGLTAGAASSVQIDLSWSDNSDNEAGFVIERRTTTGQFAILATTNADVVRFSNSGLTPGVEYGYRVKATNGVGESDYTNVASATPPVPSNLGVSQFFPLAAKSGGTILINGFGFVPGATEVYFGGDLQIRSPQVTVFSPTQAEVTVPDSAGGSGNVNGFITVRVPGQPDANTRAFAQNSSDPNNPASTFPEFVVLGDINRDGIVDERDVNELQAVVLGQKQFDARQALAGDVFPLNLNGSRGDGKFSGIDFTVLRAVVLGQVAF